MLSQENKGIGTQPDKVFVGTILDDGDVLVQLYEIDLEWFLVIKIPNHKELEIGIGDLDITSSILHDGCFWFAGFLDCISTVCYVDLGSGRLNRLHHTSLDFVTIDRFQIINDKLFAHGQSFVQKDLTFLIKKDQVEPQNKILGKVSSLWTDTGGDWRLHSYLVEPERADYSRNKLVMTGYGGFGISQRPRYSQFITGLLNANIAFVMVNLKGGLEYGPRGYYAGQVSGKASASTDMESVRQNLFELGFQKAGITGYSHGAVMALSTVLRHPSTYAGVLLSDGPYDLEGLGRYEHETHWFDDYGDPKTDHGMKAIRSWGPFFQTLPKRLPRTLFMVNRQDEVVSPEHTERFVDYLRKSGLGESVDVSSFQRGHFDINLAGHREKLQARIRFFIDTLSESQSLM